MPTLNYKFHKQTERIEKVITASFDPIKEWRPDPKGYFLIRVNHTKKRIELGFTDYHHVITKSIIGNYASEIYTTIIRKSLVSQLVKVSLRSE